MTLLIQICGLGAVLAGVMTLWGALLSDNAVREKPVLEWVYFANNLFILLGFLGVYLFHVEVSGVWGVIALLAVIFGTNLSQRSSPIAKMEGYEFGGLFIGVTMIIFAITTWQVTGFSRWITALWVAALVLGLPGIFIKALEKLGSMLAGYTFAAAMIGVGFFLLAS